MESPPRTKIIRGAADDFVCHPSHVASAERLKLSLEDLQIAADVHEGQGIALVSVWLNLIVWTNGRWYRWWTGQVSQKTGRRLYAVHSTENPVTTARHVALRYREVHTSRSLPAVLAEARCDPV
ncbi:hypothetical protein [Streptosporangium sp. NPDC002524]|uniref:hypothetical protein n=1 Tax=Streptosporangium sp. NPDC002524 TaxID=3154537 RepID=UPI00332D7A14